MEVHINTFVSVKFVATVTSVSPPEATTGVDCYGRLLWTAVMDGCYGRLLWTALSSTLLSGAGEHARLLP